MHSKDIDIDTIKTLCDSTKEIITIDFVYPEGEISETIGETLSLISETADCIDIKKKKDRDQNEPFIRIRDNIRLRAHPEKKVFGLFVDVINMAFHPDRYTKGFDAQDILAPVFLKVYIAPFCPHCPTVVKNMVILALISDQIQLEIIDGTLFPQKAEADQIMAAPTVICDDKHRWSGAVSAQEVMDVICRRRPDELSPQSLRAMIEAGNASSLADMMIQNDQVFPAFYDLLIHEKWPVRLGAMVTAETIFEKNASLAEQIMGVLWGLYDSLPDQVKGDIVYLTGETGPPAYYQKLESLKGSDISEDIAESVLEAMETMANRFEV